MMNKPKTEFQWAKETPSKEPHPHPCFCIGPQDGASECPCAIRDKRPGHAKVWLEGYEAGKKAAK